MRTKQMEKTRKLTDIANYPGFRSKEGILRFNPKETLKHVLCKTSAIHILKNKGFEVWAEIQFVNKRKADILAVSADGMAYVIEFETDKSDENVKKKLDDFDFGLIDDVFVIGIGDRELEDIQDEITTRF